MESNRDEALRCLDIARKYYDAGNSSSARKFCLKSISLFETSQAIQFLSSLETGTGASSSNSSSSSSMNMQDFIKKKSSMQHSKATSTADGSISKERKYTAEQGAVVRRVRSCKVTEYYDILAVKHECDDGDIKRAYRKLALALHPDKNGAPGADEAFKLVSKAFQVLSDTQKRAIYDRSGADPEDRLKSMSSKSGYSASPPDRHGGMYETEISADDLFNMFFGGPGNAFGPGSTFSSFGGGPVFTASFGADGFRTARVGRQQRQSQNVESRSMLIQLLPLLILLAFSVFPAFLKFLSAAPFPDPHFSFQPSAKLNVERRTSSFGVPYHVNNVEFMAHPAIGPELARERADVERKESGKGGAMGSALARFESVVEQTYAHELYGQCEQGLERKRRTKEKEIGLFGIGTDWEKVAEIEQQIIKSCEELKRLGVIIN